MKQFSRLSKRAIGILIMLGVQYLLGMWANIYVTFPKTKVSGKLWEYAWHQIPIALHILLAFGLLISSLILLSQAYKNNSVTWKIPALVGFCAILFAGFGGAAFIDQQSPVYSYVMATAFLIALGSYLWGLIADSSKKVS
ncbi:MAG: hypothetical protein ACHQUB_00110 [Candidatus Saccharimonadia bacterium]